MYICIQWCRKLSATVLKELMSATIVFGIADKKKKRKERAEISVLIF
jgi:hypothetical protein